MAETFNLPTIPGSLPRSTAISGRSSSNGGVKNAGGRNPGRLGAGECSPGLFRNRGQQQQQQCSGSSQQDERPAQIPGNTHNTDNTDNTNDEYEGHPIFGSGGGVTRRAFFNTLGSAGAATAAWAAVAGSSTAATGGAATRDGKVSGEASRARAFGEVRAGCCHCLLDVSLVPGWPQELV